MATWDEVRDHLRSRWRVEHDEALALAISAVVPIGSREMTQAIGLAPTEVEGRPWLSIIGELFAETELSPRGAVTYADRLPLGAIVLRGDRYLLRHGAALDGLTLIELDWVVTIIVREAVRLRANLLPPATRGAAFGNYAE